MKTAAIVTQAVAQQGRRVNKTKLWSTLLKEADEARVPGQMRPQRLGRDYLWEPAVAIPWVLDKIATGAFDLAPGEVEKPGSYQRLRNQARSGALVCVWRIA